MCLHAVAGWWPCLIDSIALSPGETRQTFHPSACPGAHGVERLPATVFREGALRRSILCEQSKTTSRFGTAIPCQPSSQFPAQPFLPQFPKVCFNSLFSLSAQLSQSPSILSTDCLLTLLAPLLLSASAGFVLSKRHTTLKVTGLSSSNS